MQHLLKIRALIRAQFSNELYFYVFFSFTFFKTHRSLFSSNFSYISLPYRNVNYFIYYAVAKTKYEMKQITTGDHDSGPGRSVQLLYIFSQCDFPFVNANPHHHQSNLNSEHWTVIVGTNAKLSPHLNIMCFHQEFLIFGLHVDHVSL